MKTTILLSFVLFLAACGGGTQPASEENEKPKLQDASSTTSANPDYDPKRGEGQYTTVDLGDKLDGAMGDAGEKVVGVKCASCHKTTDEKLVGPGWKGVTQRRTPVWIMNFITNPNPMIDKDPQLQAQLEICLVRMPNQNLVGEEARQILEFMRRNDGVK
jgi:hypothetical protein